MSEREVKRLANIIRLQQKQIDLQDVEIVELRRMVQALVDASHGQNVRIADLERIIREIKNGD